MEKHILIDNLWSRIFLPENKIDEVMIGIHGFAGDKESSVLIQLANELIKQNKAVVTFDLPCHGENDNSQILTLSECLNSIETIFNYVKTYYKDIPISVFATSFGGYLILHHLSNHDENLHKLILRAPAVRIHKIIENTILPQHNYSKSDLKNSVNLGYSTHLLIDNKFLSDLEIEDLENQPTTKNFIYILQGKKDDVVNPGDNEMFFNKHYSNQHKIIYFENADHRFKNAGELEKIVSDSLLILNNNY